MMNRKQNWLGLISLAWVLVASGFSFSQAAFWRSIESVTDNTVMDMMPSITFDTSGNVLITCHEIIPNRKYDIFLFEQNGTTGWTKTNLTNTDLISDYYSVVQCDSNNTVHVFFLSRVSTRNNQLYLHYLSRSNGVWSAVTCLTETKPWNAPESKPAVVIDNRDTIHVVFHDDSGKLLYLKKTKHGWEPLVQIPTATDSINWSPTIAIDNDDILHIVYLGGVDAQYRLMHLTRTEGIRNPVWSKAEEIVPAYWQPWHPHLAIAPDGTLTVVFACDTQLQQNIGWIRGTSGKWQEPERIMVSEAWYDLPNIAIDRKGTAYLVYHGGLGGNEGPYEIYCTTRLGHQWIPATRITNNNIFEYAPTIAIDKRGYLHLVWYGFDGIDTEIYYTKTTLPVAELDSATRARFFSEQPHYTEFTTHTKRVLPPVDLQYIPACATTLTGKRICISPGHGGLAYLSEYKIGATLYRESEMNLKVAEELRKYLETVGATVYMCRTTDIDVPLAERPKLANEQNCDLFISVHHNSYDFYTNYVSFYFHGEPEREPVSVDLCRYLSQELAALMNIPNQGAMSDYYSYWNAGYAELRGLKGRPGVLGEGSHYYCFTEEEMLRNLDYLRREAYAYFIALVKYFSAPQPVAILLEPNSAVPLRESRPRISIQLDDGVADTVYKIIPSSIQMKLDGQPVVAAYHWRDGILTYQPNEALSPGAHTIELHFANYDKINAKSTFTFTILSEP
ncbi:MAG: N-acetylmuramoyl-L-alanine amidase [bacterium]|nr:N-acetylmuramoyl-L-alanine amidase [bacterium]